jgi:cytochrome c oxidase subunit II
MRFAAGIKGLLTVTAPIAIASSALAAAGHPEPWQIGLQDAVTPVAEWIHSLHDFILVIITLIMLFVLGLLVYVMVKFNSKANPTPSKTTHNTLVEVLWTVIPVLILVAIAIPSFRLLYYQRNIPKGDINIKVTGNPSWNWTYEYPDLGLNSDGTAKASFTSYLLEKEKAGDRWLLATDVPMVVPVGKIVKLTITSDPEGIIHAWTIPSFGMKIDAIPGRLNEDWFQATKEGVYYGQCSELCGKDHAFMPIEVHVVSQDKYDAWSKTLLETGDAQKALEKLASMGGAANTLAQK